MIDLLDALACFDLIDRIEGIVSAFIRSNWKRARRRGWIGILEEFAAFLTGANAPTISIDRAQMRGIDAERLLKRHGVPLFDRRVLDRTHVGACVPKRQEKWARWLIAAKERGYEPPVRHLPRRRKK